MPTTRRTPTLLPLASGAATLAALLCTAASATAQSAPTVDLTASRLAPDGPPIRVRVYVEPLAPDGPPIRVVIGSEPTNPHD
jgi:hypothetical protein